MTIYGVTKSALYRIGGKMKRPAMCSQWNAVYVDGNWRLVDLLWASTCVKRKKTSLEQWAMVADDDINHLQNRQKEKEDEKQVFSFDTKHTVNNFYFLTDPDQLRFTHLPDDPTWQLCHHQISQKEFEGFAYVRERYWQLNMEIEPTVKKHTHPTVKGEIAFRAVIPEEGSVDVFFHYLLYKYSKKEGKGSVGDVDFHRYVFYQKRHDLVMYNLRFPIDGIFKFDIFGEDTNVNETYDLCVSFLIECREPKPNCEPYPYAPEIGWGAGDALEKHGIKSDLKGAVIHTDNGLVNMVFEVENPKAVMDMLQSNKLHELNFQNNVLMHMEGNKLHVSVRLPEEGEYGIGLFANDAQTEGSLENVCNFLLMSSKDNNNLKPWPKLYEALVGSGFMAECFNVDAINHKEGIVETQDGKLNIDFTADPDVELFFELNHNGIDQTALSKCVAHTTKEGNHRFDIELPEAGEYSINVFARTKGDKEQVYHAHTYVVNSHQKDKKAMPVLKEHEEITEMTVASDLTMIKLPANTKGHYTTNLRRRNAHDIMNQDQVIIEREGKDDVFYVTLPEKDDYVLEVFEENENGTVVGVKKYHITRFGTDEQDDEEKKKESGKQHEAHGKSQTDHTPGIEMSVISLSSNWFY